MAEDIFVTDGGDRASQDLPKDFFENKAKQVG